MPTTVLLVFAFVYAGMLLGRFPRLNLDRTGIALIGGIALLVTGVLDFDGAIRAVDLPTLALLFGLMVVSAQLRLGGFYTRVTQALAEAPLTPGRLLGLLVVTVGALAAVFSNDVVCLAVAPVLVDVCARRHLDPVPFLLALACAANVGSAGTLIGNPQNMLIGQTLGLSFPGFLATAGPVAVLGLGATWAVISWQYRGRFASPDTGARRPVTDPGGAEPPFNGWQTAKGLVVVGALLVVFLGTSWPRDVAALAGAGVLLSSRKLHSREMLGLVDWQLLVLFIGLFMVNHAFQAAGFPDAAVGVLGGWGADPTEPGWLFVLTVGLSNAVSNVPAVMLLLPLAAHPLAGPILALASTLAGNLLIVGSIANVIVVDAAARRGIVIDWRRHARTGVPVTLSTLGIAAACLALGAIA